MQGYKIREVSEADAPWIHEACQDEQIQFWTTVPKPYLIEHARSFVRGEFPEYKVWAIVHGDLKPFGIISIHTVSESGDAEIGYWVAKWGRGKGASKAAIKLVEQFARGDSKIKSLAACISELNIHSQKVAESAGLKKSEVAARTCPAGDSQTSASMYRMQI